MPIYSVEGKLGTGKTKFCVWMARNALMARRRVASNVDLRCEVLTPHRASTYVRIPDKPTAEDLQAIGHGNPDSYDEDRNGILILDELGSWLNSRAFQDKGRAAVIEWLIHARKHGWDVYLIVQDAGMIDKQVREALIEYQCRCMRMDKVRIPLVGGLLSLFYRPLGYFPKFHLVTARVGFGANQMVAERWTYVGKELHAAYDTRQVFTSDYPHGPHSVLPPWDWQPKTPPLAAFIAGLMGKRAASSARAAGRLAAPKLPVVAAIQRLPANERIQHIRRIEQRGLLRRVDSATAQRRAA